MYMPLWFCQFTRLNMVLVQLPTLDNKATNIHWQPVAFSSSYLSATEQRYAQTMKRTRAIHYARLPQVQPTAL